MTKAEKTAFEAGRTSAERGLTGKAPCYDPVMMDLVVEARSKAGQDYNRRVIVAWYQGAGREIPKDEGGDNP